jgi:hypothetical protein
MELPTWAFKTESRVRSNGEIDLVIGLRPLGRLYLYARALWEVLRTTTITITIGFQEGRPIVSHDGERIEPAPEYALTPREAYELVKRVPLASLDELIKLAQERREIELGRRDRRAS